MGGWRRCCWRTPAGHSGPTGSGKRIQFPEVDRCAWFPPDEARAKLNPAQAEFVDRFEAALAEQDQEPGS